MPDRQKQIRTVTVICNCPQCPWYGVQGVILVCRERPGDERVIDDPDNIPDWCRLEDATDA